MHSHDRTLLAKLGFSDPDKKDERHDLACQYLGLPENRGRLTSFVLGDRLKEGSAKWQEGYEIYEGTNTFTLNMGSPTLEMPVSKGRDQYKTTIGFIDLTMPYKINKTSVGTCLMFWSLGALNELGHYLDSTGKISGGSLYRSLDLNLPWRQLYFSERKSDFITLLQELGQLDRILNKRCDWTGRPGESAEEKKLREANNKEIEDARPTVIEKANALKKKQIQAKYQYRITSDEDLSGSVFVEVKIAKVGVGDILRQIGLYREYLPEENRHGKLNAWIVATSFPLHKDDVAALRGERIHHIRLGEKFDKWVESRKAETPDPDTSPEI